MAEDQMNQPEEKVEAPEVELVDKEETIVDQPMEAPLVLDADITSEEEIEVDRQEEVNKINEQIQTIYGKYKRT
ncbi:hypothetical protein EVA_21595, partial [gut metagenome]